MVTACQDLGSHLVLCVAVFSVTQLERLRVDVPQAYSEAALQHRPTLFPVAATRQPPVKQWVQHRLLLQPAKLHLQGTRHSARLKKT